MTGWSKKLFVAMLCASIAGALPAYADDPFQVDSGQWQPVAALPPPAADAPPVAAPVPAAPPAAESIAAEAPKDAPPAPAATAEPSRALNLPVMPGIDRQLHVEIDSTASQSLPASAAFMPDTPEAQKNWQKAAEAARQAAIASPDNANSLVHPPLDVRLSFLPNTQVAPAETARPYEHKRPANLASPAVKKPAGGPASAACAAIEDYRKRQLQALEGDRQTLQALQAAITQLGLQKQLGYLSGQPDKSATQVSAAAGATAQP